MEAQDFRCPSRAKNFVFDILSATLRPYRPLQVAARREAWPPCRANPGATSAGKQLGT